MKFFVLLLILFFYFPLNSMEKQEPSNGLHSQLQQMLISVDKLSQENAQLQQDIHQLEQQPKKRRYCLSKRMFYSVAENICVVILLLWAFDKYYLFN